MGLRAPRDQTTTNYMDSPGTPTNAVTKKDDRKKVATADGTNNGKGALARKVAVDAIQNGGGSAMGTSVYIAEKIEVQISFNF